MLGSQNSERGDKSGQTLLLSNWSHFPFAEKNTSTFFEGNLPSLPPSPYGSGKAGLTQPAPPHTGCRRASGPGYRWACDPGLAPASGTSEPGWATMKSPQWLSQALRGRPSLPTGVVRGRCHRSQELPCPASLTSKTETHCNQSEN